MLAAALLHDVVEDTDCELADLEDEFPPVVVAYVDALTEDKHDADGRKRSWQSRKEDHLREVAAASLEARAIVLADKLHNLGCMVYDIESGEELWSRFGASPEKVLWYHREMITIAVGDDDRLQTLAGNCREFLSKLEADAAKQHADPES
jgi:(p)ppGpp synthase/HD superfamily hydrolase